MGISKKFLKNKINDYEDFADPRAVYADTRLTPEVTKSKKRSGLGLSDPKVSAAIRTNARKEFRDRYPWIPYCEDGLKKGVFYRVVKDYRYEDSLLLSSALIRTVLTGAAVALQVIIVLKIFGVF